MPPAVCLNVWMGFFGSVNAWKLKKNCVNALIEKTCVVNVKIHFLIVWMRESALFFCVNTWIFPFTAIFKYFPDFSKNFPDFPKNRACVNFEKNLRECVNCEEKFAWMHEIWVRWGVSLCTLCWMTSHLRSNYRFKRLSWMVRLPNLPYSERLITTCGSNKRNFP